MHPKNYFHRNSTAIVLLMAAALMLTSCSSYEYVPYKDGIYANTENQRNTENQPNTSEKKSNYFSSYFSEKSAQIDNVVE